MPITDKDGLQKWHKGRPRKDAQIIHARAGLRVFPLWGRAMDSQWARDLALTDLPVLWCSLAVLINEKLSPPEFRDSWLAADSHASDASKSAFEHDVSAAYAGYVNCANTDLSAHYAFLAIKFCVTANEFDSDDADLKAEVDGAATLWTEIDADTVLLEQEKDPFSAPLWHANPPVWFTHADAETRAIWAADPPGRWDFWIRWWDGILAGKPLDWDLQRDVALIPDADWQQGPDHIARLIALIEERHRLLAEVRALKAELVTILGQPSLPAMMGHNLPPEATDPASEVRLELARVSADLDETESELTKSNPSPSVLTRSGKALIRVAGLIAKYCASLGDVALQAAAKEVGTSGTRWVIGLVAGSLILQSAPVQSLGQALISFALKLIQGG